MTDAAFWRGRWQAKADEPVNAASGRSAYGPEAVLALVADATEALRLSKDDSLLDIGCAAGLMGEHLAPKVRYYVGMDYSARAVTRFHEREGVNAVAADARALPFADETFTKVLMSSVLLCLSKHEGMAALRECWRVLRPGGTAFVSGNPDTCAGRREPDATHYWPVELRRMADGWASAKTRYPSPKIPHADMHFDLVLYK